ncbi:MAG: hypothetical protein PVJ65_08780, partial [Chromatiales bacterium]
AFSHSANSPVQFVLEIHRCLRILVNGSPCYAGVRVIRDCVPHPFGAGSRCSPFKLASPA